MISLIYVSRSLISPADRAVIIGDILVASLARNTMLGITGLLIASPRYFAHLLEGPTIGVAAVMSSMIADARHTAGRVLRQTTVDQAQCPHWQLARLDCENFGNVVVDPLLLAAHTGTDGKALQRLERLIASAGEEPARARKLV